MYNITIWQLLGLLSGRPISKSVHCQSFERRFVFCRIYASFGLNESITHRNKWCTSCFSSVYHCIALCHLIIRTYLSYRVHVCAPVGQRIISPVCAYPNTTVNGCTWQVNIFSYTHSRTFSCSRVLFCFILSDNRSSYLSYTYMLY